MNILITHGYILTGTGSNLYVSNLVNEWCKAGHNVYLVCQDFEPEKLDFADEVYAYSDDNLKLESVYKSCKNHTGYCRIFKPNIDGLLPVYVYDHYEGYVTKEFPDCTDDELNNYIERNKVAMETILRDFDVDVIQTNHTVMFPYIAAQIKGIENYKNYAVVHGSALNFTVKKHKRFVPYALKGLEATNTIIVDSKHAYDELLEFLEEEKREDLIPQVVIIPAGVDIDQFEIRTKQRTEHLSAFKTSIAENIKLSKGRNKEVEIDLYDSVQNQINTIRESYDYRHIDKNAGIKINEISSEEDKVVLFVGKYLWTKGIHLILLSIPEILHRQPNTKFVFAGFGPFREVAELIIECINDNKLANIKSLITMYPELFEGEDGNTIPLLEEIIHTHGNHIADYTASFDGKIKDQIIFTGILNHAQLKHLLPCADVQIASSVFPEAFGMVAIEAMACGVYPVVTYQSAFAEITDEVIEVVDDKKLPIVKPILDENASHNIAQNVLNYFKLQESKEDTQTVQNSLRKVVVDKYSWAGIAKTFIEVYEG